MKKWYKSKTLWANLLAIAAVFGLDAGGFLRIQPGETAVTAAAAETAWRWRDRWI